MFTTKAFVFAAGAIACPVFAGAPSITALPIDQTLPTDLRNAWISDDGSVVAGRTFRVPRALGNRWSLDDNWTQTQFPVNAVCNGISGDGSIILLENARTWSEDTGFRSLDTDGFAVVNSYAISGDGSMIVGAGVFPAVAAVQWSDSMIAELPSDVADSVQASATNTDGSVTYGVAYNPDRLLRWQDGNAQPIETPAPGFNWVYDCSHDGSVAVGYVPGSQTSPPVLRSTLEISTGSITSA